MLLRSAKIRIFPLSREGNMLQKKGFWRFLELVTGAGFLFSAELLLLLYIFFA